MQQAVDALLQLDEGTVVGQVADLAADDRAVRIAFGDVVPGILLGLLHAERDLLAFVVDAEDDDLDLVADLDQLAGVVDPLGPGHLADVDQAFDARLRA